MRIDLPDLIGNTIAFTNLKNTPDLNRKFGRVLSFNESNQKFVVKICETNEIKAFKACNLLNLKGLERHRGLGTAVEEEYAKISLLRTPEYSTFNKGSKIFNWLDENRTGLLESEIEFRAKLDWIENMNERCFDMVVHEKLIKIINTILESCPFGELYIQFKFNLAHGLSYAGQSAKALEILEECLESHFGYLPDIVGKMMIMSHGNSQITSLYIRAKQCIGNKNYAAKVSIIDFNINALRYLLSLKEWQIYEDDIHDFYLNLQNIDLRFPFIYYDGFAQYHDKLGNVEECLKFAKKADAAAQLPTIEHYPSFELFFVILN